MVLKGPPMTPSPQRVVMKAASSSASFYDLVASHLEVLASALAAEVGATRFDVAEYRDVSPLGTWTVRLMTTGGPNFDLLIDVTFGKRLTYVARRVSTPPRYTTVAEGALGYENLPHQNATAIARALSSAAYDPY